MPHCLLISCLIPETVALFANATPLQWGRSLPATVCSSRGELQERSSEHPAAKAAHVFAEAYTRTYHDTIDRCSYRVA